MLTYNQMHHATFGAWCRRNGVHVTRKQRYRNWNAELLEPIMREVPEIWKLFDENVERSTDNCALALEAMLDDVRNNLQGQ